MNYSKAKKSVLNILSGCFSQLVTIALGIVIPRLVLVSLGSEANGLLNSVGQVLVYVGLLEAGVGLATTQALYGPIAKNNYAAVSGIMSATNRYYKKTGVIYFAIVIAVSIIYPTLVQTELDRSVVFWVIILSAFPNVINYYFQGKYKLLLKADGKSYVITNTTLVTYIFTSLTKIGLLLSGFGVVALQAMYLVFSIAQMLFYSIYIRKNYAWLDVNTEPDFDSISSKNYVLFHQISGLIFSNTDIILITLFCGLKTVSVYSMYVMLFGMIGTAIQTVNSGVMFSLGQTYNANKSAFAPQHDAFELYNMTLTFSLFCIANIFILPFMRLYTAGVTDIQYIDPLLPYLFIATYLLENGRTSSMQVINYAGHFKQTKNHALIEMIINLSVSLVGVSLWGIYGVLVGTIAALLFRANAMILYAARQLMNRSSWITYRRWLLNLTLFIVVTFICKKIPFPVDTYVQIFLSAFLCCLVIIPLFFFLASIFDIKTYQFARNLLGKYIKQIRRKIYQGKT